MKTDYLALEHFRALQTEKPRSTIKLLRGLYPEIVGAANAGHTLKEIHRRLVEDGIDVSYPVLRNYVSRIRRERGQQPSVRRRELLSLSAPTASAPVATEDPLANAMKALSKPRYDIRKAMCDGDPTKKKLI